MEVWLYGVFRKHAFIFYEVHVLCLDIVRFKGGRLIKSALQWFLISDIQWRDWKYFSKGAVRHTSTIKIGRASAQKTP